MPSPSLISCASPPTTAPTPKATTTISSYRPWKLGHSIHASLTRPPQRLLARLWTGNHGGALSGAQHVVMETVRRLRGFANGSTVVECEYVDLRLVDDEEELERLEEDVLWRRVREKADERRQARVRRVKKALVRYFLTAMGLYLGVSTLLCAWFRPPMSTSQDMAVIIAQPIPPTEANLSVIPDLLQHKLSQALVPYFWMQQTLNRSQSPFPQFHALVKAQSAINKTCASMLAIGSLWSQDGGVHSHRDGFGLCKWQAGMQPEPGYRNHESRVDIFSYCCATVQSLDEIFRQSHPALMQHYKTPAKEAAYALGLLYHRLMVLSLDEAEAQDAVRILAVFTELLHVTRISPDDIDGEDENMFWRKQDLAKMGVEMDRLREQLSHWRGVVLQTVDDMRLLQAMTDRVLAMSRVWNPQKAVALTRLASVVADVNLADVILQVEAVADMLAEWIAQDEDVQTQGDRISHLFDEMAETLPLRGLDIAGEVRHGVWVRNPWMQQRPDEEEEWCLYQDCEPATTTALNVTKIKVVMPELGWVIGALKWVQDEVEDLRCMWAREEDEWGEDWMVPD